MNNDKIIIDKHYYYVDKNLGDRIWLNIDEKKQNRKNRLCLFRK